MIVRGKKEGIKGWISQCKNLANYSFVLILAGILCTQPIKPTLEPIEKPINKTNRQDKPLKKNDIITLKYIIKAALAALFMGMSYKIILFLLTKKSTSKEYVTEKSTSKEYVTKEEMEKSLNEMYQEIFEKLESSVQYTEDVRDEMLSAIQTSVNRLKQKFVQDQVNNVSQNVINRPINLSQTTQEQNIYQNDRNNSKRAVEVQSVHYKNLDTLKNNATLLLKDIKTPMMYRTLTRTSSSSSNLSSILFSQGGGRRRESIDILSD